MLYKKGFSIQIACKDASARLPTTLEHIALLETIDDFAFEVIIVSNGSTDDTVSVAKRLCEKLLSTVEFKIIDLTNPGKSDALNVATINSSFEYLLLCDDDNWLEPNYLIYAFNRMQNLAVGVLGGVSEYAGDIEAPKWFLKYITNYAVGFQNGSSFEDNGQTDHIWGAGMVIRHSLYKAIQKSNHKLFCGKRTFSNYIAGEDYEFCLVAKYFGYEIWYDNRLKLKHYMPAERLSWEALKKLHARNCIPALYLTCYEYVDNYLRGKGELDPNNLYKSEIKSLIYRLLRLLPKKYYLTFVGRNEGSIYDLLFYTYIEELKEVISIGKNYDTILSSILKLRRHIGYVGTNLNE